MAASATGFNLLWGTFVGRALCWRFSLRLGAGSKSLDGLECRGKGFITLAGMVRILFVQQPLEEFFDLRATLRIRRAAHRKITSGLFFSFHNTCQRSF